MTKPRTGATPLDLSVASEPEASAEVRAWVARRLRFEHLLASLEQKAGYRSGSDRSPQP
jgi:hypothetical protein